MGDLLERGTDRMEKAGIFFFPVGAFNSYFICDGVLYFLIYASGYGAPNNHHGTDLPMVC